MELEATEYELPVGSFDEVSRLTLAALRAAVDNGAPAEVIDGLLDAMRALSTDQGAH